MTTALVLAGHGSHISPQTAGLIWVQVDALRAMGVADEVTAAFWKEMPSFSTVLNTLTADDITIVPLFTASGYFTGSVIPGEMGLAGTITTREKRTLRYARAVGEHLSIRQVVRQRVEAALRQNDAPAQTTGVAIIGHGTKRNLASRTTTEAQAQMLRDAGLVRQVVAVFLDDSPSIPDIYDLLDTPIIIAVPNFLALGSHTTLDVPADLGLQPGQTVGDVRGRRVYYTDPVGVGYSLCEAVLDLAKEAGAALYEPVEGSSWDCFPAAGRALLAQTVNERGEMPFGQLILTPSAVRTAQDGDQCVDSPAQLREMVRTTPAFRPLATSADLSGGWSMCADSAERLHAIVETVYPGAVADWVAQRLGIFETTTLAETAIRQRGMFRALEHFPHTEQIVSQVCAGCVRQPTWVQPDSSPDIIPCPEPCNLWLNAALELNE